MRFIISIFLILMMLPMCVVRAEVKRQAIPVGMFNVYSRDDGNLGLPTPDLREVWEGMPTDWGGGHYPYETCNLVQHYWPRTLPSVQAGQDPHAAWWIDYLRQVYEAGNEDGEIRLRAIVGALYEPYAAFGETWFRNFITALCEWERSGPQDGVIAGWYLAEEPMGSRHNYDPNVLDDMVDAIEYVESEGGYRRHDRYVDTSLGGKYYSPYNLIRFTRPADVVMLSSGTYLWQISGVQPVYEPKWENIHTIMYKTREIIFEDRDRYRRPRPQIHLVLEIYDTQGYGQPTNWETRQQIRLALSPDVKKYRGDSEPADGLWFFWWSGLTFNNEEHVSDWVYGRRLAEAIEMEVAAMTGHEGEIQSPTMPARSRFVFPDNGAFNPKESAIPYELAYPGKVRIEVLNADMTLVDSYERGVQSAGLLHRFGGPHWMQSSSEPDGQYTFRLYVDSILMDTATVEVQSRPGLTSSSHIPQVWSNENVITVTWKPNPSSKGISSFSYLWDTLYWSYPEKTYMLSAAQRELTSEPLEDGDSHYFHLRSRDSDGQWSSPVHIGPFYIDATPPSSISGIASTSHTLGLRLGLSAKRIETTKRIETIGTEKWSTNNIINLSWMSAQDAASGLKGYSHLWDTSPGTLPPKTVNLGWGVTELSSSPLPDGQWYFHIRSVDLADNWESAATHFGPFRIDTQPPTPPSNLTSTSHTPRIWSNNNNITLSWQPAVDEGSGIAGYLSLWDESPDTIPARITNPKATLRAKRSNLSEAKQSELRITNYRVITKLPDSNSLYFHLRSMDKAGQLSGTTLHLGPFYIDTTPPSAVTEMTLFNSAGKLHNTDDWLTDGHITVEWQPTKDEESGISEYEVTVGRRKASFHNSTANLIPNSESEQFRIPNSEFRIPMPDGEWLFQVRARDVAGNRGAISEISIRVDSHIAMPSLTSPSHPAQERWYSDNAPILIWTYENTGDADLSGIAEYRWAWDASPTTVPDKTQSLNGDTEQWTKSHIDDGVWYFHLVAVDNAGNISDVAHYKVQIDAAVPKTPILTSNTHPKDKWTAKKHLQLQWKIPEPNLPRSGIVGYSYLLDNSPTSMPDDELESTATSALFTNIDDGIWYFHLKVQSGAGVWSIPAHYAARIDTAIATPKLSTSSHPHGDQWYTDNKPTMTWTIAEDTSGIAGYSFVWDNLPGTIPDAKPELLGNVKSLKSELPTDGVWYFHLVAVDNAGNVSEVVSYPIHLDTAAPEAPIIRSLTHPEGQFYIFSRVLPREKISQWTSEDRVEFTWQTPDSTSGIVGYSFVIDQNPKTFPKDQLTNTANKRGIQHLPDGIWYFHLKAQSRAGLWSETAHYEIRIDTAIPTPQLSSPSHPKRGKWYTDNVVTMTWTIEEDTSGIVGYSFIFDHAPDTVPDRELDVSKDVNTLSHATAIDSTLSEDGIWYFHLIAVDNAGNVSEVVSHPIYLDTAILAEPVIISATHPEGQWISENQVELTWHLPTQSPSGQTNASGIEGYSFLLDHKPTNTPLDYITTTVRAGVEPLHNAHLADGIWYFHLKALSGAGVWSPTAHYEIRIDTAIPTPQLSSPSHPKRGKWYTDNEVTMTWTIGEDISGIAGYSFIFDHVPDTVPDRELDVSKDVNTLSHATAIDSTLSEDGIWYFHLIAIDNAGNVSEVVSYPIYLDTATIAEPVITSATHPEGQFYIFSRVLPCEKISRWTSEGQVELTWHLPTQSPSGQTNTSGIEGYSFLLDHKPTTTPPDYITITVHAGVEPLHNTHLADGIWYFHLKALSGAGVWSPTAHYEIRIDTAIPTLQLSSPSHPKRGQWYTDNVVTMTWTIEEDTSGIAGFSYVWDHDPDTVPDNELDVSEDVTTLSHATATDNKLSENGVWYFHLMAMDNAGNVSDPVHYDIRIDSSIPLSPEITSSTHPILKDGQWTANSTLELDWLPPASASSIMGYSFLIDQKPTTAPADQITSAETSYSVVHLPDGVWYFHLKAQNGAGRWSPAAHYTVRVDTESPSITIDFPRSDTWYTEPITEYYGHSQDAMSGVDWDTSEYRYGSIEWRTFHNEEADQWRDTDEILHLYETSPDAGGLFFQVRVRDLAGNVGVSEPVTIRVDSSSPTLILMSPTHPDQNAWYADNQPLFRWQTDTGVSSIVGYNWHFDQQPETKPSENIMLAGDATNFRISLPTDGEWYFHLRAQDGAGNWSAPYHYRVNIDTTPPQAHIALHASNFVFFREYRHAKKNSDTIYQSTKSTIPRVGAGTLNIRLTLSEPMPEGMPPTLRCQPKSEIRNPKSEIRNPKGTRPFILKVTGDSLDWNAVMHIDMHTGDGKAEFQVEAVDKAGNVGTEITEGKFFVIDTLLRADATETQYVLDERAQTAISILPGALTRDIRIAIVPETTELSAIAVRTREASQAYRTASYFGIRNLKAFDDKFHALPIITFSKLVELTFGWREAAGDAEVVRGLNPNTTHGQVPQIFYDDGVHTYRIGGTVKNDKITARVNHLGTFMIAMSKPIKKRIANGWAAPNPFTPNGSGDDTDQTIFQVQTQDNNVQFTIKIFDITGRRVRTLEQGNRVWDGRDEHGRIVEGGVYIYQIRAGDEVISGTVVVVK